MEWSDEAAAKEAARGNTDAFRLLVERHSRGVFRLAYRMTANQSDAEDLVQETFLRAFRELRRFDGRASFGTWIYRICTNCTLDLLRARKTRCERSLAAQTGETDWLARIPALSPSPERLTQSVQVGGMLEPAMQSLSDQERVAFTMRHFEGCDIAQIARVLGVHDNAAKHSVFRAVQKLRRALEPAWKPTR